MAPLPAGRKGSIRREPDLIDLVLIPNE